MERTSIAEHALVSAAEVSSLSIRCVSIARIIILVARPYSVVPDKNSVIVSRSQKIRILSIELDLRSANVPAAVIGRRSPRGSS